MKTLPLTVLLHNGPIGRAYLGMLEAQGYAPERIVLMVSPRHPGTARPMGRWLPLPGWRLRYRRWAQDVLLNQWSRVIRNRLPELHDEIRRRAQSEWGVPASVVDRLTDAPDWSRHGPAPEPVLADGLGDGRLVRALEEDADKRVVLFTGGGLVPASLLSLPGLRMLHIHPGWLPQVRGADGLLWSLLVRGQPGASAFYMDPGLDTGDIVARAEYAPLALDQRWLKTLDTATLYRVVFAFIDPLVRARLLAGILEKGQPLNALPVMPQSSGQGVVYHFMHPVLQQQALARLFLS